MCRRLRISPCLLLVFFRQWENIGSLVGRLLGYVLFFCILEKRESLLRSENQTTFCCLAQDFAEHFLSHPYTYDRETKPSFKSRVFFAFPAPPTLPLLFPPQKKIQRRRRRRTTNHVAFFLGGGGIEGETHGLGPFRMTQNDRLYFFGVSALITGQPATLRRVGWGWGSCYQDTPRSHSVSFFWGGDHLEVLFVKVSLPSPSSWKNGGGQLSLFFWAGGEKWARENNCLVWVSP